MSLNNVLIIKRIRHSHSRICCFCSTNGKYSEITIRKTVTNTLKLELKNDSFFFSKILSNKNAKKKILI